MRTFFFFTYKFPYAKRHGTSIYMKPSCAKFHDNTEQIHIAWSNVKME